MEDALLSAFYGKAGPDWSGWEWILPGRSATAIVEHASRLGLKVDWRVRSRHQSAAAALRESRRRREKSLKTDGCGEGSEGMT